METIVGHRSIHMRNVLYMLSMALQTIIRAHQHTGLRVDVELTVSVNPPKTSIADENSSILYLLNNSRFANSCTPSYDCQPKMDMFSNGRTL